MKELLTGSEINHISIRFDSDAIFLSVGEKQKVHSVSLSIVDSKTPRKTPGEKINDTKAFKEGYVMSFSEDFVEIRSGKTGKLKQIICVPRPKLLSSVDDSNPYNAIIFESQQRIYVLE